MRMRFLIIGECGWMVMRKLETKKMMKNRA